MRVRAFNILFTDMHMHCSDHVSKSSNFLFLFKFVEYKHKVILLLHVLRLLVMTGFFFKLGFRGLITQKTPLSYNY